MLVAHRGHFRAEAISIHVTHLDRAFHDAVGIELTGEVHDAADRKLLGEPDEEAAAAHVLDMAWHGIVGKPQRAAAAYWDSWFRAQFGLVHWSRTG